MPSKETNKASITDLKGMEIYELSDKKFSIILLKFKENGGRECPASRLYKAHEIIWSVPVKALGAS